MDVNSVDQLEIPRGFALRVILLGAADLPLPAERQGLRCHRLPIDAGLPDFGFVDAAVQAAEILRGLLLEQTGGDILVQAVTLAGQEQCSAGITALLRTLRLENPRFRCQHIEVEAPETASGLCSKLEANLGALDDSSVRYRDGVRQVQVWEQVSEPEPAPLPWKQRDAVYLITGGGGGLGLIFAEAIAASVDQPALILAGRSAPDQARRERFERLQALGARVDYRQVDVSREDEAVGLLEYTIDTYGKLHGLVHAAGVLRDNYLLNKTAEEVRSVLAPKVAGTLHLDRASQQLALDFFVVFSSIAGAMGNPGQADYAMGNAFMDAFAEHRNALVAGGQRCGRTLSINWPLWRDGGMSVDATTEMLMRQHTGLEPLESEEGLQAFADCLATGLDQVMVAVGQETDLLARLAPEPDPQPRPQAVGGAVLDAGDLKDHTLHRLQVLFGDTVRMPVEDIDAAEPLESYGIDSIVITHLNQQLAEVFGALSKTLFYEYQTLDALAAYLSSDYPEACARWSGTRLAEADPVPVESEPQPIPADRPAVGQESDMAARHTPSEREPIAIIGVSGRYPRARNLDEFWQNLKSARDCIGEVPAERWSLEEYFEPDPEQAVAERKSYGKWGAFLEGFADFDPLFFNMSPREALNVDPQERLFLACCWELFEDAGYSRQELAARHQGRVGVFAGITKTGFDLYGPPLWAQGEQVYPHTSFGSVANRISYLFDFHGPSMPIDTMCSSSLVALHEACEHLYRDECEMAVAGGVNLYLHPASYVSLSAQQMLSRDGKCRSFGAGGDGFVPGEGVGMVLLKPLSRALADGDHIHALIRGTSTNHGGKTNGYTVPNPGAQAELVRKALQAAGVDARQVSYVEAHGTGTALGDPIEITGLTRAFQDNTGDAQFCAIGSAKSNIGHLEAAAGIAGLTKVLLQLKHRQLVPSLHARELNPNIEFSSTPFRVQQDLTQWEPSLNGQPIPRIAGISSFGAGGANAHAVLEEYVTLPRYQADASMPALVLLSAADSERLQASARRLLEHLRAEPVLGLHEIAFTLQVGREAMAHRLAFPAYSLQELEDALQAYLAGEDTASLFRGEGKPASDELQLLATDEDMGAAFEAWLRKRKFGKLLKLWVKGLPFDWRRLYGQSTPRRTSLPGYPFKPQRYWMPERYPARPGMGSEPSKLHPLVHENISDFQRQCFRSQFTGREFFLADHVIQGSKILPGVAYLEMARAAGALAGRQAVTGLENLVWAQAIRFERAPLAVSINLQAGEQVCDFEISTGAENSGQAPLVHAQGRLRWSEAAPGQVPGAWDIEAIRERCTGHIGGEDMVARLEATGLGRAGPGFHAMTALWFNAGEALAQLTMPDCVQSHSSDYELHPSMLDVAFEAVQFLLAQGEESPRVRLPFALRRLRIHASVPQQAFAYARPSPNQDGGVRGGIYDIDILDEKGEVRVAFEGYASVALEAAARAGLVCARPVWHGAPLSGTGATAPLAPRILLSASVREWEPTLRRHWPGASVEPLSDAKDAAQAAMADLGRVVQRIQDSMAEDAPTPLLLLTRAGQDTAQAAAYAALLRTARREHPALWARLIECGHTQAEDALIDQLQAELGVDAEDVQLRLDCENGRHVRGLEEVELGPVSKGRGPGVIWITGGLGGLGTIFARHLSTTAGVKLVLSGRSQLDATGKALIAELQEQGAEVLYLQSDVSREQDAEAAAESILQRFGRLNTIVHSAGVVQDAYLRDKDGEQIQRVLAPKIAGALALDRATRSLDLDHFVLFSSLAGSLGNPGQADYAAANAFMDGFAEARNRWVAEGKRHGHTLSIAWPLWEQGGMVMDKESQDFMQRAVGMTAMDTGTGIEVFDRALEAPLDRLVVAFGDQEKIRALLRPADSASVAASTERTSAAAPSGQLLDRLLALVAEQQDMDPDLIDPNVELPQYGYDSIGFTALSNRLNKLFGLELMPTLFFEHSTLRALASHLSPLLTDAITAEPRGSSETGAQCSIPVQDDLAGSSPLKPGRFPHAQVRSPTLSTTADPYEPIAVIGMSGRFPDSDSLEDFWHHLEANHDLSSEVPADRWNWRDCYGDPLQEQGKTRVKRGSFLSEVDRFDPLFFGMAPDEAELTDPQMRLFMQTAWSAIEDAGYAADTLAGSMTGVFVGVTNNDYQELLARAGVQAGSMEAGQTFAFAIPNRISYLMDFHGPSEAIDTACSSSLIAVHRAVQAIRHGNCELALAGGVNLMLTPSITISGSRLGTLSRDGRCKTFDQSADGYGRGEGVGAVLLKPLSKALADGDRIHGLIRNSAENHGGKASSPSAPNPVAQADLLTGAYREVGIDPRSVGYIEAHGTGTELGDPIEINALKSAFARLYEAQGLPAAGSPHCVLGSVKTNIGHLEAAAGISGLIKVLLMLRHGKVPGNPQLHNVNPYLQLAGSPLRLARDTETWKPSAAGVPRRAGVSSFGVGGANAHVIVEEFVDSAATTDALAEQAVLVVLSARTGERLSEQVRRLLNHLDTEHRDSLPAIAYTLQTGRKAMRERLGFVADSLDGLRAKLRGFLDIGNPDGLVVGKAGPRKDANPEVLKPGPKSVLDVAECQGILQHWVNGGEVDWPALYASRPRKARLPSYPFARSRYWISLDSVGSPTVVRNPAWLHPLLHRNDSGFDRQCYSANLDGTEFFLADHQVDARKILPAVAYLEMAHAALVDAARAGDQPVRIRNMVWAQPLVVEDQARTLEIVLQREGHGDIGFELSSRVAGQASLVHGRGTASWGASDSPPRLDLAAIRAACAEPLSAEQCYERFARLGFDYGPGLRGIQAVFADSEQVLARLSRPAAGTADAGFVLHPAIMDSALQASIGLLSDASATDRSLPLPFALDAVEIHGPCPAQAWAWLRSAGTAGDLRKFDIDIADSQGRVLVRLQGLSSRISEPRAAAQMLICRPVWQDQPDLAVTEAIGADRRFLVLCQLDHLADLGMPESVSVQHFSAHGPLLSDRFEALALRSFEFLRDLMSSSSERRTLVQWVLPDSGEDQVLRGLSGLLKTATRENPALRNQLILVDEQRSAAALRDRIEQCAAQGATELVRYRNGRRQTLAWQEVQDGPVSIQLPWKEDGVYLISGGAGGLGLLIAEEIVTHVPASLILLGRSALDKEQRQRLAALGNTGARVDYRQLDVSRQSEVEQLVTWIGTEFGQLSGVMHAAGEIRDNFILRKTAEEFCAVLRPKLAGCINLDAATAGQPLDFFLLFSSIAGVWGNAGQSDYAAGNAFMDAFADYRKQQRANGERSGLTVSVNWPYWQRGGMHLDPAAIGLMQGRTGLAPLGTGQGITALRRILSLNHPQLMVLSGDTDRLRAHLDAHSGPVQADVTEVASAVRATMDDAGLAARAVEYFRAFLATALKLPLHEVQADELFEQYGIDSVRVMQLTADLEAIFGSLPKTLFFEYQTLEELSGYFQNAHGERLHELLQGDEIVVDNAAPPPQRQASAPLLTTQARRAAGNKEVPLETPDIAIIGLAGRYPQAPDLAAFWDNLKQGRDCISEVPASRWDWRSFYAEQGVQPGGHTSKWGGFIEDIDCFDPMFFNISPLEAEFMDPQERLFIETAWHAMEDAGYCRQALDPAPGEDLPGQVGVYAGLMYSEYQLYAAESCARGKPRSLSGSYAGLANRVSFIFNLHGPSMTVDTMCSSSLTCLHLACQDLKLGRTNMAIAGGVNLSIHPNKYTMLSGGRFISTRGRCESFGEGGEGYIPSEGVGVTILKRLEDAQRDGDAIYGVIKGSALNHGGKTNGYSVPNPNAQQMAIARALDEAGIDPRAFSYVEAHGTGTKLGDPIEIAGLSKAFRKFTEDSQFCYLGSVKSNIGHCEAAAGIAGLTKVLLQLKHGQIAPSLHSEALNPHIDFAASPFVVNQALREWQRPNIDGRTLPRVAGVSSFGAGGSNAHMVIQEYVREPWTDYPLDEPQLLPLSAKDGARLRELIQSMLAFVREHPTTRLVEMAFTLQVGREAMPERLALVVTSLDELQRKLQALVDGADNLDGVFLGSAAARESDLSGLADDEVLRNWLESKELLRLADDWVRGRSVNWRELHGSTPPLRISLPGYPFARERYWAPDSPAATPQARAMDEAPGALRLVPDAVGRSCFSTLLSGDEFFLTDHKVRQQKVLPGVVYLELARAAAEQCAERESRNPHGVLRTELRNLVWARPIIMQDRALKVHVALEASAQGELNFQVLTDPVVGSGEAQVVHSRGVATWVEADQAPCIDLAGLQAQRNGRVLQAGQCYELFAKAGIEYGPAHRGLTEVYPNQGAVLAKLTLPSGLSAGRQDFVLHPSLMDAALQACIGLSMEGQGDGLADPALPYALDALHIHGECSEEMWAWIRRSDSHEAKRLGKLDLDLCDSQGRVAVGMRGLAFRPLTSVSLTSQQGLLLARPRWRQKSIPDRLAGPMFAHRYVLLCDWPASAADAVQLPDGVACLRLHVSDGPLDSRYRELSRQVFETIRQFLGQHSAEATLLQLLVPDQDDRQTYAGISGLLKTLQLENPNFTAQMILADPASFVASNPLGDRLRANGHCPEDSQIRYRNATREVLAWDALGSDESDNPIWKDGGVYLLTGGAGGLGAIAAREIAGRPRGPVLILTGRSAFGPSVRHLIEQLDAAGARALYRQVDVTDESALRRLLDEILNSFGGLDGILHTAGITRDAFLMKKDPRDFDAVMAPKVSGTVNLERVTRDLNVDFLLLFSSLAGVLGNAGQGDYAAANGFMDAFAAYHNGLAAKGRRRGRILSVNWPLWREGGMQMDGASLKIMQDRTGMVPLESEQGMVALERALGSTESQLSVMQGELSRLRAMLEPEPETVSGGDHIAVGSAAEKPPCSMDRGVEFFKSLLANRMKIPMGRIRPNEPLQQYGMDSIIAMQMVDELAQSFGPLPQTLFFEYQSIEELCRYFMAHHPEAFGELIGEARTPVPEPDCAAPEVQAPVQLDSGTGPVAETDIAVIGLCGRYPQAIGLDEFWKNLCEARDCISEVPRGRWNHALYFDEDRTKLGKSYSKWGGFIEDVDKFDSLFFNISPNEAQVMDPQERLFLETVWELLEGAAYTRETIRERFERKVGVFVGAMYQPYQAFDTDLIRESLISLSSYASIANRVSYFFDFQGPSIAVDTMCSSSLMAVHMACESLLKGEARMAVAGGVNLSIHPKKYIGLSAAQLIGSKPESRSFAQGDGYLPAEGVGAVLLKPLAQAVEDGDEIHAVIKSVAANHGGSTHGYHLPNMDAQARLIEENFRKSGIDPRTISYVESAANGSALGDPIEMRALIRAFRQFTQDQGFCSIGSVKANIGHAEAASGISQLTKVILQLRHRRLTPVVMQGPLHPEIRFEGSPFRLQQSLEAWRRPVIDLDGERREVPLRATVSSFGAGGSNAHLIVEEYVPPSQPEKVDRSTSAQLVVLSARSPGRLRAAAQNLAGFLQQASKVSLSDLAYTLQVGREAMSCRLAIVVGDIHQLIQGLVAFGESGTCTESDRVFYGAGDVQGESAGSFLDGGPLGLTADWPDKQQWKLLARQWADGARVDWARFHPASSARRIPLPTYPFERKSHWLGNEASTAEPPADEIVLEPEGLRARESLLAFLAQVTGLSVEAIDLSARLADFGVDSLIRLRLLNRINAQWGVAFDAGLVAGDRKLRDLISDIETVLQMDRKANPDRDAKWTRSHPSFIQSLRWPVRCSKKALKPKRREAAIRVLGNLCAQGVGVWRDAQGLCFEFFAQTQDEQSIRRLIPKPKALASVLEPGKRYYPASHVQQMALHETEVKRRGTFNLLQAFWMDVPADLALLQQALNELVRDHAIFRTEARRIDDTWIQVMHDSLRVECREISWPTLTTRDAFEQALQAFQKQCSAQLHDIHQGPLYDLYLVHNEAQLAAVFFHTHHFHADGFSFFAFQRELLLRYQALASQRAWPPADLPADYAHFALSQFDPDNERHTRFWSERFADQCLEMELRDRKANLKGSKPKAGYLETELSPKRLKALKRFNRKNNTTLTQLVSCAWSVLCWRVTGRNLPLQMVNNLRDRIEFEPVMGDFSSALPMMLDLDAASRVRDLFQAYDQAMTDIQRHKRCDVPELRRRLNSQQDAGAWGTVALDSNDRDSLLDVSGFAGRVIPLKPEDRVPVGQLLILVVKTDERLSLSYLYDTSRLSRKSMKLILAGMDSLLKQMIKKPNRRVRRLSIPEELKKRLVVGVFSESGSSRSRSHDWHCA